MTANTHSRQPNVGVPLRSLSIAWKVIAAAGAAVFVYGVGATLDPSVLTAGFETYADRSWADLVAKDGQTADFLLLGFRLLGVFNVAAGALLAAIAVTAFRSGHPWAWWALLFGHTLTIGGPIAYDRAVGFVGIFEALEYVALVAVYAGLAATAPMLRWNTGRPAEVGARP